MRFKKPMDDLLQVRVSRDEKRRLKQLARSFGMTLSEFLRSSAIEAVTKEAA